MRKRIMELLLQHDKLFRKALEYPLVAKEFLEKHLPEDVKILINLSIIEIQKESFVEEDLKAKISDVLFTVKTKRGDAYIYLLLEHQSKSDPIMPLRLFRYMMNICDRHKIVHPKSRHLPLVYPIVFYNGKVEYNVPRNL